MARQAVNGQLVTPAGLNPSFTTVAQANGATVGMEQGDVLALKNTSGAPVTATVITPGSVDGIAQPDLPITVPASSTVYHGRTTLGAYRQSDGRVYIDVSAALDMALLRGY